MGILGVQNIAQIWLLLLMIIFLIYIYTRIHIPEYSCTYLHIYIYIDKLQHILTCDNLCNSREYSIWPYYNLNSCPIIYVYIYNNNNSNNNKNIWVVIKIMVPFWIPIIVRPLIFRVPKRGHNFDNHPDNPILNPI